MNSIIESDIKDITRDFELFSKFQDSKTLITGANGFLASYMVETLLYLNKMIPGFSAHVTAVVRNEEKAKKRFSEHLDSGNLSIVLADVSTYLPTQDYDYIIHSASQASPKYYGIDPVGTILPNTLGTYNLLNYSKGRNLKGFLFFSSGEVYGEVSEESLPTTELSFGYLDCANVRACYGESKRLGETLCASFSQQYGIPTRIVRPYHTYGPGLDLNDGRVFADFISSIVNKKDIVLHSDGSATRVFCYLADAVKGFFTVLIRGENGGAYNVGNPDGETSILNLANMLVDLYRDRNIQVRFDPQTRSANYLKSPIQRSSVAIDKVMKLGWRPLIGLEEGFRRTVDSFLIQAN